jgi:hypothetical protein
VSRGASRRSTPSLASAMKCLEHAPGDSEAKAQLKAIDQALS